MRFTTPPTLMLAHATLATLLIAGLTPAAHATDIVLRDGVADPSQTGTRVMSSGYRFDQVPASTSFPVAELNIPQDVELRQLVVPVARFSTLGSIYSQAFRLRLWPTIDAAAQNVWAGTLIDAPIVPIIEPWGTLPNGKPKYLVTFDLTPLQIALPPGPVYFSVGIITPNTQAGLWGVLESVIDGGQPPDYVCANSLSPSYTTLCGLPPAPPGDVSYPNCQYTGRFAFRLTAEGMSTCPACPADYDANGGVDGGDLAAFFVDFEAGTTCADVDLNGGVDGGDLGAFFVLFEAGGC